MELEPEVAAEIEGLAPPRPHIPKIVREEREYQHYEHKEVVVEPKTGLPRQAGATQPEGEFIKEFRRAAEKELFVFAKGVMGRDYLTKRLHLPICRFIQKTPPFRKLTLLPRDHAKTSIVGHCLPPHVLIQPAQGNIYFPGLEGCECRVLLAGETATRASDNLRVVSAAFAGNQVLRALWPHRCWADNPKKHGVKWNDQEIVVPRETAWPDPSVRAIGVGGAITGARPNVMIKDDLISVEAANSEIVMRAAIEWHKVSRALLDEYEKESGLESLEWIIGTRWAVADLYSYIMDNDATVEVIGKRFHSIIKDGRILWPERFTQKKISQLRHEFGTMFYLLYLNSAADPSLTDFDLTLLRTYEFDGEHIVFEEGDEDVFLEKKLQGKPSEVGSVAEASVGLPFNSLTYESIVGKGRGEFFRMRYG